MLKYFQVASPVFAVFQPYYRPSEVVEVPSGFPRVQGQWFSKEPSGGVPQDIAFFVFAMEQNNYIQYVAAQQLQSGGWAFEAEQRRWYLQKSGMRVGERARCEVDDREGGGLHRRGVRL